jgi:hypothetical protein
MESENYYMARGLLAISAEISLVYYRAASKFPTSQAMLSSEDRKFPGGSLHELHVGDLVADRAGKVRWSARRNGIASLTTHF